MALSTNTVCRIKTTGSDTANGGGFDPSQTAGMNTDGAATSATGNSPVFSSASYNFVAGDVGAWVYIASGTNWTAGWYEIASVASNNATLKAAVGEAISSAFVVNTTAGCATTASPTSATWSIDYSKGATAQFTYTDITYVTGTTFTSAGFPFGKQQVGNVLRITGGTNFTTGHYVITSVTAGVATLNGTACSGASSNGAGGLGGCLLSPGYYCSIAVDGNLGWLYSGTYACTNSSNVSGGRLNPGAGRRLIGCNALEGDYGTRPILQASGSWGGTDALLLGDVAMMGHFNVDGNSKNAWAGNMHQDGMLFNCDVSGYVDSGNSGAFVTAGNFYNCSGFWVNIATGSLTRCYSAKAIQARHCIDCIGLSFSSAGNFHLTVNCTSTGAGLNAGAWTTMHINGLSLSSSGYSFTGSSHKETLVVNGASYSPTSGRSSNGFADLNPLTPSGTPVTNSGSGDYSLDNTSGEGAILRGLSFAFPGLSTTTAYKDIGAVQHQDSGGSAGILSTSNMTGNMI